MNGIETNLVGNMVRDKDNNVYPVFISQFSSASIKLAFVKKSLYKGGMLLMK